MNYDEIIKRLRAPFDVKEIEWKIQVTSQDKASGMAIAYVDARAVQKRLDEAVGPFNWKNLYSLWHTNSQICGIGIFDEDRDNWVIKFDGAENSDIEPVKGGLSDSFKRAANMWGIGRYLYELDGVWVNIEPKGKSHVIKKDQYGKLEAAHNTIVAKVFGDVTKHQRNPASASVKQPGTSAETPAPANPVSAGTEQLSASDFKVKSIKPSGKSAQLLELVSSDGNVVAAYIKAGDQAVKAGDRLRSVRLEQKQSTQGPYNVITDYQVAA